VRFVHFLAPAREMTTLLIYGDQALLRQAAADTEPVRHTWSVPDLGWMCLTGCRREQERIISRHRR
jgi:hypothetical protein